MFGNNIQENRYCKRIYFFYRTAAVSCDLLMCGWKGYAATRVYLCKNERMHYLNLCGHPVPDRLIPNNNSRRGRAEEANLPSAGADGATPSKDETPPGDAQDVNDVSVEELEVDGYTAKEESTVTSNIEVANGKRQAMETETLVQLSPEKAVEVNVMPVDKVSSVKEVDSFNNRELALPSQSKDDGNLNEKKTANDRTDTASASKLAAET